jgi:hypothetical protein
MKDIQKIKEFFSQPMKESLTGGYPHTKTSGENFEKITITEPIDDDTKNKMIKNFRAAGWDAKPNNGGGITAIKKSIMEGNKEYFKPIIRKDKSNPNFLYVNIAYPEGSGVLSVGGSKTMSGQDREEGAVKALAMGNAIVKKLQAKYNIEDIEVNDLKNGKVQVFAVSDDFIKMSTPSLDEAKKYINEESGSLKVEKQKDNKYYWTFTFTSGKTEKSFDGFNTPADAKRDFMYRSKYFKESSMNEAKKETAIDMAKKQLNALGVKYEMSKTDKVRPFKVIYKPTGQSDEFYDTFEDIVDLFNLKGVVKSSMGEAKFMSGMLSGKDFINAKLKNYPKAKAKVNQLIDMIGESKFTIEMAEWIFDFFNNAHFESPINEAKKEDKVDTITMDIPLFIRMLEYSREDAAEDMDLHDVTEKAISLGKERGILQMNDYDEIIGTTEKVNEVNLKQAKLSSAEYQKAKKLKDFKASDWKWNADEDLYTKVNEAELTEAYVPSNIKEFAKRKGVSSLVNKVAGWAEKAGKGIRGGTAIGKDYSTLVLDMTYQGGEIRINTDNDTITLYDEPVNSFNEFQRVYIDGQDVEENVAPNHDGKAAPYGSGYKPLEEKIAKALDQINEELCPAGKAYRKRRMAAGEKSSAYLSGRAVKVCKGQMSGKKKKK